MPLLRLKHFVDPDLQRGSRTDVSIQAVKLRLQRRAAFASDHDEAYTACKTSVLINSMKSLTARQAEILNFIRDEIATRGLPPTAAEIAAGMGVSSTNGIRDHLKALARKGAIELISGASRGIRLIETEDRGLPIVGRVAAGSPILAEQHVESYCRLDHALFKPRADYLLRVKGTSMRDAGILDGDLLVVHKTSETRSGQIVVARLEDEVTVKRLRLAGRKAVLEAANPEFAPIEIDLRRTALNIEGLGVGVIRNGNL
jgi:repressor LexA